MKVMILGCDGQLGITLLDNRPKDDSVEVIPFDMDLDITKPEALEKAFNKHKPDVVVNAAAYTNVDGAEDNEVTALEVNGEAPAHIVDAADEVGARVIHISTDFVFDGKKSSPYTTSDATNPLSVYGLSKLRGEKAVLASSGNHSVIRTSWLYSYSAKNFVQTMLRLMAKNGEVSVVCDQVGTPTSAETIAKLVWKMVQDDSPETCRGLWHLSDAGCASWYDFAVAINALAMANQLLPEPAMIWPIKTEDYPTKATRPAYSVMDCTETRKRFQMPPEHWMICLGRVMAETAILP